MRQFTEIEAIAAPMRADNIDTDQIIPARFLRKPRREGYQNFLFHDQRFNPDGTEKPGFVLNQIAYRNAQIILAGKNFACGSSREGAVYALSDFGVRSIIAPSFGDIFFNNALINGLLPVRLAQDQVDRIFEWLGGRDEPGTIAVDLARQEVRAGGGLFPFRIDGMKRRCMLEGLDEISLTRTYGQQIEAFERRHHEQMPWLRARR